MEVKSESSMNHEAEAKTEPSDPTNHVPVIVDSTSNPQPITRFICDGLASFKGSSDLVNIMIRVVTFWVCAVVGGVETWLRGSEKTGMVKQGEQSVKSSVITGLTQIPSKTTTYISSTITRATRYTLRYTITSRPGRIMVSGLRSLTKLNRKVLMKTETKESEKKESPGLMFGLVYYVTSAVNSASTKVIQAPFRLSLAVLERCGKFVHKYGGDHSRPRNGHATSPRKNSPRKKISPRKRYPTSLFGRVLLRSKRFLGIAPTLKSQKSLDPDADCCAKDDSCECIKRKHDDIMSESESDDDLLNFDDSQYLSDEDTTYMPQDSSIESLEYGHDEGDTESDPEIDTKNIMEKKKTAAAERNAARIAKSKLKQPCDADCDSLHNSVAINLEQKLREPYNDNHPVVRTNRVINGDLSKNVPIAKFSASIIDKGKGVAGTVLVGRGAISGVVGKDVATMVVGSVAISGVVGRDADTGEVGSVATGEVRKVATGEAGKVATGEVGSVASGEVGKVATAMVVSVGKDGNVKDTESCVMDTPAQDAKNEDRQVDVSKVVVKNIQVTVAEIKAVHKKAENLDTAVSKSGNGRGIHTKAENVDATVNKSGNVEDVNVKQKIVHNEKVIENKDDVNGPAVKNVVLDDKDAKVDGKKNPSMVQEVHKAVDGTVKDKLVKDGWEIVNGDDESKRQNSVNKSENRGVMEVNRGVETKVTGNDIPKEVNNKNKGGECKEVGGNKKCNEVEIKDDKGNSAKPDASNQDKSMNISKDKNQNDAKQDNAVGKYESKESVLDKGGDSTKGKESKKKGSKSGTTTASPEVKECVALNGAGPKKVSAKNVLSPKDAISNKNATPAKIVGSAKNVASTKNVSAKNVASPKKVASPTKKVAPPKNVVSNQSLLKDVSLTNGTKEIPTAADKGMGIVCDMKLDGCAMGCQHVAGQVLLAQKEGGQKFSDLKSNGPKSSGPKSSGPKLSGPKLSGQGVGSHESSTPNADHSPADAFNLEKATEALNMVIDDIIKNN